MATQSAHFEPVAWWWARDQFGQDLRKRYEVPKELPPKLRKLIMKVDAIEGNQLLSSYSATTSEPEQWLKLEPAEA